jgi:peptidoglycan/LPS O-acetylase OafA/YrhL
MWCGYPARVPDDTSLSERLAARLLELIDIPSESRDEAALAAHVACELRDAAVEDLGDSCLLAYPLLTTGSMDGRVTWEALLAHGVFAQQEARLLPGYSGALGFAVDPVVWTLSLEALFYLVLPLVAGWFWRWAWQAVALAVVVGVAGRLALGDVAGAPEESVLLSSFPLHLTDFAAGMAAALLFVRWRVAPGVALIGGGVCGLLALGLVTAAGGADAADVRDAVRGDWLLMATLPLLFGGLVLGIALAPERVRAGLAWAPLRWVGTVSYGVFLVHYPLLLFARTTLDFDHDGSRSAFLALTAFAVPASLLVGWVSWVAVERPARNWARRRA